MCWCKATNVQKPTCNLERHHPKTKLQSREKRQRDEQNREKGASCGRRLQRLDLRTLSKEFSFSIWIDHAEPTRNPRQSKIKEASTRRGDRRLQTHLGCVCSTESPHAKDSGGVPKSRRAAVGKELSPPQETFSEEGSVQLPVIGPKVVKDGYLLI